MTTLDWPSIIAAVISSLVTAVGWLVNYRTSLGLEKERRLEKVRDFQIALRAEIRSELHQLNTENLTDELKVIEGRYAKSKTYSVFVPSLARHVVFESLIRRNSRSSREASLTRSSFIPDSGKSIDQFASRSAERTLSQSSRKRGNWRCIATMCLS